MYTHWLRRGFARSLIPAVLELALVSNVSFALPRETISRDKPNRPVRMAGALGFPASHAVAPASLYAALATVIVPSFHARQDWRARRATISFHS
jgi:hypothetical protein